MIQGAASRVHANKGSHGLLTIQSVAGALQAIEVVTNGVQASKGFANGHPGLDFDL